MPDSLPCARLRIRDFFKWLCGRRARELGQLAYTTGAGAEPLTMTEVRHPDFSIVLPGAWQEQRRTAQACQLLSRSGAEGLNVALRKLPTPLPDKDVSAIIFRLLGEQQKLVAEADGEELTWSPPEVGLRDNATQGRSDGYAPVRRTHYALLERIHRDKILSAVLWTQGDPFGGPAFSNAATIIFNRLEQR